MCMSAVTTSTINGVDQGPGFAANYIHTATVAHFKENLSSVVTAKILLLLWDGIFQTQTRIWPCPDYAQHTKKCR